MAYISESDLLAKLPSSTLTEALDDNGDAAADVGILDSIIESASLEIDGQLSGRHVVPFTGDIPPLVKWSCTIFVLEMLYGRRGWADEGGKNPWSGKAAALRMQLKEIGMGLRPLSPARDKLAPNIAAITGESRLTTDVDRLDA